MESKGAFFETFGLVFKKLIKNRQVVDKVDVTAISHGDHTLITRWENDQVLPTRIDLLRIRETLKLSEEEYELLCDSWERMMPDTSEDNETRVRLNGDMVEFIEHSILVVRGLRKMGNPRLASIVSERDASLSIKELQRRPWNNYHIYTLTILAELLLEQCKAGLDYLTRAEIRAGALKYPIARLEEIYKICNEQDSYRYLIMAKEGVSWVSGNIGNAHELGKELLLHSEFLLVKNWRPEILRACALNAGNMKDSTSLREVESKFRKMLDDKTEVKQGSIAFVLEGLARGWATIDLNRSYEILDQAWNLRTSSDDNESLSTLRFVQLVRTQCEIECMALSDSNLNDLESKVEDALNISLTRKFDRYIEQLKYHKHYLSERK